MRAYLQGRDGQLVRAFLWVEGRPPVVCYRVFEVGRYGESEVSTVVYRFDHEISDVGLVYVEAVVGAVHST